jgi:hypothetical protein
LNAAFYSLYSPLTYEGKKPYESEREERQRAERDERKEGVSIESCNSKLEEKRTFFTVEGEER